MSGAGSASGEIDFLDRVNDVSFTDFFSLELIPRTSPEVPERIFQGDDYGPDGQAITRFAWWGAEEPDLLDDPIVLRQQRPGFADQNTYGLLSACEGGSQRGITMARADTHTELIFFHAECADALCTEVHFEGFSHGFPPEAEFDEPFIEEVDASNESHEPPPGSLWFFGAAGDFDLPPIP